MNANQQKLISDFLSTINPDYREQFSELAEYADELGFRPARNKTQDFSIDFKNGKLKATLMKFEEKEQCHDGFKYGERNVPGLRLKFYGSKEYSEIFSNAVRRVIEAFDGKYTGCYGCGKCGGKPQGYVYQYPDGKKIFRCGGEQLSIFNFENSTEEIKRLMKRQAEYYSETTKND